MRIGWILGWAVPEGWFAPLTREAFPEAEHVLVPATADALHSLEEKGPFDWVAGYSLGTQLLLADAARSGRFGRVALLAPIFALPSEANRGGKVSETQIMYLARQMRHRPREMLADFYGRIGLDIPLDPDPPLVELGWLQWGLTQLAANNFAPSLPEGWRAWCGDRDALLDASVLHAACRSVTIVPSATHHPRGLLRAYAKEALA